MIGFDETLMNPVGNSTDKTEYNDVKTNGMGI